MSLSPFFPDTIADFKWPVTATMEIAASPSEIWDIISTPANLEICHPFCRANPVQVWPGVGSRDIIHYYSGWVMKRAFISWQEGKGYDLLIGREREFKSLVSWRISN